MTKNSPKPYKCHHMQWIFDPKMTKTAKTRIFPVTAMPLDDSKQLSTVSDQVLDKSDVWFRRKCPKTLFISKNGQILDQKGSKNGPNFIVRTTRHSMIGSPERVQFQRNFKKTVSFGQKIDKFWSKMAKISPFPAYRFWFSQRRP